MGNRGGGNVARKGEVAGFGCRMYLCTALVDTRNYLRMPSLVLLCIVSWPSN